VPTFAELVQSYFDSEKFSKLYPTTQTNRRGHLKAMGSLMQALGHKRVEEITADALIDW
jgi:hypothetical protein